jgi:predicted DNA-binding protein (MmcQ/YjbR family)
MPKPPRILSDAATALLPKLRVWTATLPNVELTITFGNRTYKINNRAFLVLDRYRDIDCLWLRVPDYRRAMLLTKPGWFPSPYDPKQQALCVAIAAIDGRRIRTLIRASSDLAAKR